MKHYSTAGFPFEDFLKHLEHTIKNAGEIEPLKKD